ncbi:transmembrane protein 255B [Anguilla anguilla]|uniref:transmembrane protein 255B n=1 Tax=Anguilla anguilla TaxID=7936 RepID=UPI0015AC6E69|nr:transmembrane protein 255B [Anguilla anguilla]
MTPGSTRETTEEDKPKQTPSPADLMKRRRRKSLWLVVGMLCLALLVVALGIYTTTRTESLHVTGYASGIILAFGSFLGILGLCLEENRKQLLVAAIVFLSFGILTSFFCVVVDGVFILLSIDTRPLRAGRCQFYSSGKGYIYENYYASVPCQGLVESCSMKVRSGTCYCCDLYDCANGGYLNSHFEFVGVRSCQEVLSLYVLIWVLTLLNLAAFILGILSTAVLGSIKDMKSHTVSPDGSSQLSILRHRDSVVLSPTAPLVTDAAGHSLYPSTSLYFTPAAGMETPQGGPSDTRRLDPHPPPFAPLYSLLPYKKQGFSV